MTATSLQIINAALTRTGHNQITSFTDGSAEAEVASANYERVIRKELTANTWSFSTDYSRLNRINTTPNNKWDYVFQLPENLIKLRNIEKSGYGVEYMRRGDRVYCNEKEDVWALWQYRSDEDEWADDFIEALIVRFEGLFLRALAEKDREAQLRDEEARISMRMARHEDAKNKTPRDIKKSRLVQVRSA